MDEDIELYEELARLGASPEMFNPNAGAAAPKARGMADLYRLMLKQAPYGQRERDLSDQQAIADELRGTAAPGMHTAGRVSVAANPLEFLGAGVKQYRGWSERDRLRKEREDLFNERLRSLGD